MTKPRPYISHINTHFSIKTLERIQTYCDEFIDQLKKQKLGTTANTLGKLENILDSIVHLKHYTQED